MFVVVQARHAVLAMVVQAGRAVSVMIVRAGHVVLVMVVQAGHGLLSCRNKAFVLHSLLPSIEACS